MIMSWNGGERGAVGGRPAGAVLDSVLRGLRSRVWQRQTRVRVGCAGQRIALHSRPSSTDAEVIWQCFIQRQYEIPTNATLPPVHRDAIARRHAAILAAGQTPLIVDAGANIGASARWLDARYPGCRVIAIEPAPDNCEILRRNCADRPNVTILQAAIGPADSTGFLHDCGGGGWGYQVNGDPDGLLVKTVSLASLLRAHTDPTAVPLILKIDIEGGEQALFAGDTTALNAFPLIIVEPHDFYLPGRGTALPFFRFHAEAGRDFLFGAENIFSFDMAALAA